VLVADLNQLAARLVQKAANPAPPESIAQTSGRKGGLKGDQGAS